MAFAGSQTRASHGPPGGRTPGAADRSLLARYLVPTAVAVAAGLVRLALEPVLQGRVPFALFVPAALFGAWYGGPGPGLVATIIGGVLGTLFTVGHYPVEGASLDDLVAASVYALSAVLAMLLASANQRTRRQATASAREASLLEVEAARNEGELRSHARLIELAHDAIIVHDPEGQVTLWNRGAEALYGWPREEAKGRLTPDLLQTEFPVSSADVKAALDRTGYWEGELIHTARDGRRLNVASRWALHRDAAGRPLAVLEINRDITGQKRAADEIRALNADLRRRVDELQALLDVIPIGIAIAEDRECRHIHANPVLAATLGVDPDANTSVTAPPGEAPPYRLMRDGRELAPDEMPMQVAASQGRAMRDVDVDVAFADGSVRSFITSTAPLLDAAGEPGGCVTTFLDITERRVRERRLAALNERLRRAMSETHHRVKNNLQVVAALVDLQVMKDREAVPVEELRRLGQHVRSLAAVHDLLTQEARVSGEAEHLRTKETLERLRPMVSALVGDRALRYVIDDVDLPVRQGTALAVLVNELVSNAAKHGCGDIDVSLRRQGDRVLLETRDRGPGFPADFDVHASANTGLELVENLAKWDLAGEVVYGNHPEGGGQVTVRFPIPAPTDGEEAA